MVEQICEVSKAVSVTTLYFTIIRLSCVNKQKVCFQNRVVVSSVSMIWFTSFHKLVVKDNSIGEKQFQ